VVNQDEYKTTALKSALTDEIREFQARSDATGKARSPLFLDYISDRVSVN